MPIDNKAKIGQNTAIIVVFLLMIGLGGTYQFLLPQYKEAVKKNVHLKAEKKIAEEDLRIVKDLKQNLESGKESMINRGISMNDISQAIPINEDMPGLYILLESIKDKNVNIAFDYQLSNPVADIAGGGRIPVSITAKGSYASLKELMQDLEYLKRPLITSSFSFGQSSDTASGGNRGAPGSQDQLPETLAANSQNAQEELKKSRNLSLTLSGYFKAKQISDAYKN